LQRLSDNIVHISTARAIFNGFSELKQGKYPIYLTGQMAKVGDFAGLSS
jgi:hypothetical protein